MPRFPPLARRSCREPERCSTASPEADRVPGTHLTPALSPRKRAEREVRAPLLSSRIELAVGWARLQTGSRPPKSSLPKLTNRLSISRVANPCSE
jgi:hypothetical protein